jgi:hypothetical protein
MCGSGAQAHGHGQRKPQALEKPEPAAHLRRASLRIERAEGHHPRLDAPRPQPRRRSGNRARCLRVSSSVQRCGPCRAATAAAAPRAAAHNGRGDGSGGGSTLEFCGARLEQLQELAPKGSAGRVHPHRRRARAAPQAVQRSGDLASVDQRVGQRGLASGRGCGCARRVFRVGGPAQPCRSAAAGKAAGAAVGGGAARRAAAGTAIAGGAAAPEAAHPADEWYEVASGERRGQRRGRRASVRKITLLSLHSSLRGSPMPAQTKVQQALGHPYKDGADGISSNSGAGSSGAPLLTVQSAP